jgi:hypothetical protein
MESAKEWDGDNRSSRMARTAERSVLRESAMGAGSIVVVGAGAKDPAKMRFAQDDYMIQALSSDRADEPSR